MRLENWETVVSGCEELYFEELVDRGSNVLRGSDFSFVIKDNEERSYEVSLEKTGLYFVVDEEYLTKYWNLKGEDIGWTFVVEDSPLPALFPGVLETEKVRHYVISTYDYCLEILSESEPIIRRRRKS